MRFSGTISLAENMITTSSRRYKPKLKFHCRLITIKHPVSYHEKNTKNYYQLRILFPIRYFRIKSNMIRIRGGNHLKRLQTFIIMISTEQKYNILGGKYE